MSSIGIIGIIGGSGVDRLADLEAVREEVVKTPYGAPSSPLQFGTLFGCEVVFLPRHGSDHAIPPHAIDYRANIEALHQAGAERVVALAAAGGIDAMLPPGRLVVPDQIIDYTWGRQHTFFDGADGNVEHIDFTRPYCETLRRELIEAGVRARIEVAATATYAATQGPRLETAAEIDRLERDGAHIVGMTGMPEAALAAERGLCYATLAVVVNAAAGRGEGPITMQEIEGNLVSGARDMLRVLEVLLQRGEQ